jgi:hypothetical protein
MLEGRQPPCSVSLDMPPDEEAMLVMFGMFGMPDMLAIAMVSVDDGV